MGGGWTWHLQSRKTEAHKMIQQSSGTLAKKPFCNELLRFAAAAVIYRRVYNTNNGDLNLFFWCSSFPSSPLNELPKSLTKISIEAIWNLKGQDYERVYVVTFLLGKHSVAVVKNVDPEQCENFYFLHFLIWRLFRFVRRFRLNR